MNNKLCIGTAQFDMMYGISSKKKKLDTSEIYSILDLALANEIYSLETARNYGESEIIISNYNKFQKLKIITKLNPCNLNYFKVDFNKILNTSLENLNYNIDTLMLHDYSCVDADMKKIINKIIYKLKKNNLIKKFGISLYSPNDYDFQKNELSIDVVQIPLNIFDQRFLMNDGLEIIKRKHIDIHARSAFLQGLLLMEKINIPKYFYKWIEQFNKWHEYLKNNNIDAVTACICFIKNIKLLDKIIIGIENHNQLLEIINIYKNININISNDFKIDDINLINPSKWIIK